MTEIDLQFRCAHPVPQADRGGRARGVGTGWDGGLGHEECEEVVRDRVEMRGRKLKESPTIRRLGRRRPCHWYGLFPYNP